MLARLDLKRDDSEYLRSLNVLYVEDDEGARAQLEQFLDRRVGSLAVADSGREGLALFQRRKPDIVITAIAMPDMDGLTLVEAIRKSSPRTPVIITTTLEEMGLLLKAIELGVDAYVLKPVKGARLEQALLNCARNLGFEAALKQSIDLLGLVLSSLDEAVFVIDGLTRLLHDCNQTAETLFGYRRGEMLGRVPDFLGLDADAPGPSAAPRGYAMEQTRMRAKSGAALFCERYVYTVHDGAGRPAYVVVVVRDVCVHKRAAESALDKRGQFEFLGYHDPLTGLVNRLLFHDRLQHALAQARRRKDSHAVLFLNLDRFKPINDLLGHEVGDQLLQAVAARLALSVREQDTVARFGGDEFVLLLEEVEGEAAGGQVAATVINALGQSFDVQGQCLSISASIGLSLSGVDSTDAEALVKQAAHAMARAKRQGGGCFCFYGDDPAPPR